MESRNGEIELKSHDTWGFKKQSAGSFIVDLPRDKMDPNAPRLTRKCDFKWEPITKTLRITKCIDGKRQVEWVGLKTKAIGLAQPSNWVITQAQVLEIGSVDKKQDNDISLPSPEHSPTSSTLVDHVDERELGSSDEETHADGELGSSDEETHADGLKFTLETPTMAISYNPMGDMFMELGCTAVEVEEPSSVLDLALIRVDLAEDFQGTVPAFESGISLVHEESDPRLLAMDYHSHFEVA